MKKLSLFLLVMAMAFTAVAETFTKGNLTYEIKTAASGSTAGVVECTGLSDTGKAASSLTVSIPNNVVYNSNVYAVKTIAANAFASCTNITTLNLSATLETVGKYAFMGCTGLTSATITSGTIDVAAFYQCSSLTTLNLDGVTRINMFAFGYCTSLKRVTLPASLKTHTFSAFYGCSNMTYYYVDEDNTTLSAYYGVLYNKDKTTLYRVPEGRNGTSIFAPTVTTIMSSAFQNNKVITSIAVPYGVTSLGSLAFDGCTALTTVEIPSSVKSLGTGLFQACTSLADLYLNLNDTVRITKSSMFNGAANPNLYVQYNTESKWSAAGWTDFASYNKDDVQPADSYVNSVGFTVTSTEPTTVNGVSYAGRCKVVHSRWNYTVSGSHTIPPSVTIRGKEFAVTSIERIAYRNITNSFTVRGCVNIDSVGSAAFHKSGIQSIELPYASFFEYMAFADCASLTTVTWGNRLKRIEKYSFENTPLECDIILPPGVYVGYWAFKYAKSKKVLIPMTSKHSSYAFTNMPELETVILNSHDQFYNNEAFYEIPSSCKLIVPAGTSNDYKTKYNYSKIFASIEEGSYDFGRNGDANSPYKITVTKLYDEPDDDGYWGEAQYDYSPLIASSGMTTYDARAYENDVRINGEKKYRITAFGNNCCKDSKVTTLDFTKVTDLQAIGDSAFSNSRLIKAVLPDNYKITFGYNSFVNASQLTEILVGAKGFDFKWAFFGSNADSFQFYVPYNLAYDAYDKFNKHASMAVRNCVNYIGIHFTPSTESFALGTVVPLWTNGEDYRSYVITEANASTGKAKAQQVQYIPAGQGTIFKGCTLGQTYKIRQRRATETNIPTNLLLSATEEFDVFAQRNACYWNTTSNTFVTPTSSYKIGTGSCYLNAPGNADHYTVDWGDGTGVTGDINGDGIVDITDVNAVINMVLGKLDKTATADVDGSGDVDITDVNTVINIMLGK